MQRPRQFGRRKDRAECISVLTQTFTASAEGAFTSNLIPASVADRVEDSAQRVEVVSVGRTKPAECIGKGMI